MSCFQFISTSFSRIACENSSEPVLDENNLIIVPTYT